MARRTASAASISSWEFKLGWLDSSNTFAVVSHKAEYDAGDVGEPCQQCVMRLQWLQMVPKTQKEKYMW